MDQPTQPRGDFVAFLNRDKQPGDKLPIFKGHIAKPGSDETVNLSLWAHEYTDKITGEIKIRYSGELGRSRDSNPADQIATLTNAREDMGELNCAFRAIATTDSD
ncbi:MAG: hypothetical protein KJ587_07615 [Alphaproteobacteria bacterium]|nr:hypothetical protein [Alphaproteobacteria bacterium]